MVGWPGQPSILRIGLGIVFLWFGILKLFPGLSPAEIPSPFYPRILLAGPGHHRMARPDVLAIRPCCSSSLQCPARLPLVLLPESLDPAVPLWADARGSTSSNLVS